MLLAVCVSVLTTIDRLGEGFSPVIGFREHQVDTALFPHTHTDDRASPTASNLSALDWTVKPNLYFLITVSLAGNY